LVDVSLGKVDTLINVFASRDIYPKLSQRHVVSTGIARKLPANALRIVINFHQGSTLGLGLIAHTVFRI
jgi:hypothetical protein